MFPRSKKFRLAWLPPRALSKALRAFGALGALGAFAALALCEPALARQSVANADRGHVEVRIAALETNRLAIDGRRIATVVPSVEGALSIKKDEALGALYFTLARPQGTGTVTLFVTDDQGTTYTLLLLPRAIAGEDILITPPVASASGATSPKTRAATHDRQIKDLVLIMADESASPASGDVVAVNKEIPLWREARLVLVSRLVQGAFVGEKYRLLNVSGAPMVLAEQELYRKGVEAVAVQHHNLAPQEATDIFIVRDRGSDE
jgi:conjugal transfer pilus assembly protein TraK